MRIVYLSHAELPSRLANSVNVIRMCEAFARAGHDVCLIGRGRGDTSERDIALHYGIRTPFPVRLCRPVSRGSLGQLLFTASVFRAIRRLGPVDLYYGRHRPSLAAATALGTPLALEVHNVPRRRLLPFERHVLRSQHLTRVISITRALADEYLQVYPRLDPKRVVVAPDGADPPADDLIPKRLPRRDGALQVGYLGHLFPGKGMEMILALARRAPDVEFHVVGGTEADIARWRPDTDALDNIVMHGFVRPAEVPAYAAACDVLVAPYQREVLTERSEDVGAWMSPLKLFEYMAAGKAIICSDLGVLREVVEPGVTALTAPADDVEQWLRALRSLEDEETRARLGSGARSRFIQRYTWDARATAILDAVSQAME